MGLSIVGYGIDLMDVSRIEDAIARFGDRFINRIYTPHEQDDCTGKRNSAQIYSAYWAVKEATMKALGTGMSNGVYFKDIEVRHHDSGKPYVVLYGESKKHAEDLHVTAIHVSMSHLEKLVMGSVIFEDTAAPENKII